MNFKDILNAIPTLTDAQLEQVMYRVRIARHLSVPEVRESDDWLWQGFVYELRRCGLIGLDARPKLRGDLKTKWDREVGGVQAALQRYDGVQAFNPQELVGLGKLAARALTRWLERAHVPISIQTMVRNIGRTVSAFDDSFPGYLAAGMIRMLVQRDLGGTKANAARSTTATAARVDSDDAGVRRPARGQDRRAGQR